MPLRQTGEQADHLDPFLSGVVVVSMCSHKSSQLDESWLKGRVSLKGKNKNRGYGWRVAQSLCKLWRQHRPVTICTRARGILNALQSSPKQQDGKGWGVGGVTTSALMQ